MHVLRWWPFGSAPEIDAAELYAAVRVGAVQIVDVRTRTEFRSSRIPHARHLPITRLIRHGVAGLELDRKCPVVAVCLTAHRSVPAVRMLREQGFDAKQLRGGMRAWWRSGLPCEIG